MLSTDFFFLPSERKDICQQNVDNEVSALAKLSTLMGVCIKYVELKENVRAFPRDKEKCP